MESTMEERKRGQAGKTKFINDFAYGIKYEKIQTGKGQSVALINKSPFLLIWGYFSDKAWGFPQLFKDDKPSYFDTVS